MNDRRLLILHFRGNVTQRLKFYPNSTRADLLDGIREVLGVLPTDPLRFRDSDGDIVILSPPGIPSGTELHVEIESGIPPSAPAPAAPVPPAADPATWAKWATSEGSGSISTDEHTFTNSIGCESWSVYTPILPTSGEHYFTIALPSRSCCISIGFIPSTLATVPGDHLIGKAGYSHLIALRGVGKGPANAYSSMVGEDETAFKIGKLKLTT
jgi:hypothetical protein